MNTEILHSLLKECGQKYIGHSADDERIFDMGDFAAPDDLMEWLDTITQYEFEDTFEFLPGWDISPFERSKEVYKIVKDMNTPGSEYQELLKRMFGNENDYLEKYWNNFLLLADYSDGGCGIGSEDSAFGSLIIVHEIHAPWQVGFQSMDKLVETARVCRKSGVWKNDGEVDWNLYYQIGQRLNPECEHWFP